MPSNPTPYGPNNPHPLSTMKTELVWEGKYDEYGNRRPVRLPDTPLPLQKIETVDEPRDRAKAEAARQGDLFDQEAFTKSSHRDDFRNMLIWGDNKLALAALLDQYRGKVDLIYIDPPFDVGADFTMNVQLGDEGDDIEKQQSILEAVAYRDTWGRGSDSYIHMMYERLMLLNELMSEKASIYVHCDWRVNSLLRLILDDVFGNANAVNEIIWKRTNVHSHAAQGTSHFSRIQDTIHLYAKAERRTWHQLYSDHSAAHVDKSYKYVEEGTGRRYSLGDLTVTDGGPKGNPRFEFFGVTRYWRYNEVKMLKLAEEGRVVQASHGAVPRQKRYLDESPGSEIGSLWADIAPIQAQSGERLQYATQKPEPLIDRILTASSNPGDLVLDCFCGSGTTCAVAEKLGRRWIGVDLGRYAIHTTRKRLIQVQRELHAANQPYRSFDVYNLGRYERQWWQADRLKGADDEHRKLVLRFYGAATLTNSASPLLHGTRNGAFVHVDEIDTILVFDELAEVARAAKSVGARTVHCLAWEFEMDLARKKQALEAETGLSLVLKQIPREIMEANRDKVQFFEAGWLQAEARADGRKVAVALSAFHPALAEAPERELEALRERAVTSPFDFIDFWAVDFTHRDAKPFEHHWQEFRTRKDRSLKTVTDLDWEYTTPGLHRICVKVIDVFGVDTTTVIEVTV